MKVYNASTARRMLLAIAVGIALILAGGVTALGWAHFREGLARGASMDPAIRGADWHRDALRSMTEFFPSRTVSRGGPVSELPAAAIDLDTLPIAINGVELPLTQRLADNRTQGIVVLHRGRIVYERYWNGADATSRFTSFSTAKSFTATLVGIALGEGRIASLDDPLTHYLPELVDTGYDGVTIRQALRMASGVSFDETYGRLGGSDVDRFMVFSLVLNLAGADRLAVRYPRDHAPGSHFNYNTAETQVLGRLVRAATGETLASSLERMLWRPLGMEHDAAWLLDRAGPAGVEVAGCCLNAALRDWARFGLLHARGGVWQGRRILPEGWVAEATGRTPTHEPSPLDHYQYQWWIRADGSYAAEGVYGQLIWIDPLRDVVIAKASAWPIAWDDAFEQEAFATLAAIADHLEPRP